MQVKPMPQAALPTSSYGGQLLTQRGDAQGCRHACDGSIWREPWPRQNEQCQRWPQECCRLQLLRPHQQDLYEQRAMPARACCRYNDKASHSIRDKMGTFRTATVGMPRRTRLSASQPAAEEPADGGKHLQKAVRCRCMLPSVSIDCFTANEGCCTGARALTAGHHDPGKQGSECTGPQV